MLRGSVPSGTYHVLGLSPSLHLQYFYFAQVPTSVFAPHGFGAVFDLKASAALSKTAAQQALVTLLTRMASISAAAALPLHDMSAIQALRMGSCVAVERCMELLMVLQHDNALPLPHGLAAGYMGNTTAGSPANSFAPTPSVAAADVSTRKQQPQQLLHMLCEGGVEGANLSCPKTIAAAMEASLQLCLSDATMHGILCQPDTAQEGLAAANAMSPAVQIAGASSTAWEAFAWPLLLAV